MNLLTLLNDVNHGTDDYNNSTQQQQYQQPTSYEPVYETLPVEMTLHWIFSQPQTLTRNQTMAWRGVELIQILRGVENLQQLNSEEIERLTILSESITSMRRILQEKPLQTDFSVFLIYLSSLKQLETLFQNNTTPYQSYFPLRQHSLLPEESSSLFLFEYINTLLFTVQALYQKMRASPGQDRLTIQSLSYCQALLSECYDSMESAFVESNGEAKWKYRVSPVSIGSGEDYVRKYQSIREGERESLKIYIREFLCGVTEMENRIDLLEIRKNEIKVHLMRERERKEESPLVRQELLYREIVPMIRIICQGYERLIHKYNRTSGYMIDYVEHMSYFWFLTGEFLLAGIDWTCSNQREQSNFVLHGRQSLKRLEEVLIIIREREVKPTRTIYRPDYSLESAMSRLKADLVALENQVREAVEIPMAYSAESVQLRAIETFRIETIPIESGRILYRKMIEEKWNSHLRNTPSIGEAFSLLNELKNRVILPEEILSHQVDLPQQHSVIINPEMTQVEEKRRRNRMKQLVMEERMDWLEWLLAQVDRRGEIRLTKEEVEALEEEYKGDKLIVQYNQTIY